MGVGEGRFRNMINIKMLKAGNGDCIILSYGESEIFHILIDGGRGRFCFRKLCSFEEKLKKEAKKINAVILTHIDHDHIDGILKLFSKEDFDFSLVNQIWFNFGAKLNKSLKSESPKLNVFLENGGTSISWKEGKDLEEVLREKNIKWESFVKEGDEFEIGGARFIILSPSIEGLKDLVRYGVKEKDKTTQISSRCDYEKSIQELNEKEFEGKVTITNKSSIAFLFEYKEVKILFLGDADSADIVSALERRGYSKEKKLKINFCKIAHHASKHNTSNELVQMLDCSNYLISTQMVSERPSKECLSRIICNSLSKITFYSNYSIKKSKIFKEQEIKDYGIQLIDLDESGINVEEMER